jgi:hypothetical protein
MVKYTVCRKTAWILGALLLSRICEPALADTMTADSLQIEYLVYEPIVLRITLHVDACCRSAGGRQAATNDSTQLEWRAMAQQ